VVAKFWSERVTKGQVIAVDHESSNIHVTRATVSNAEKARILENKLHTDSIVNLLPRATVSNAEKPHSQMCSLSFLFLQ
jgi:hypothetical protein